MSKISKNPDFAKFTKMGFPKCDFFRKWTCLRVWTERPKICYHVYLYVIWHFVMYFFDFSWFLQNLTFLEKSELLEKAPPRLPGVTIFGNVRVQNPEKVGKSDYLWNKSPCYRSIYYFLPFLGSHNKLGIHFHFPKICNISKMLTISNFNKSDFQKWFFC